MTKQPGRAYKSLKERFFDYLTRVVLTRHFQRMKLAKQDTNYIEQQLMIKTNQGAKRIGVVTLQFVDGMTPVDKVNVAEALAVAEQIKAKKLQDKNDSLVHKLKLSINALEHSECVLKKARSFFNNDPINVHRQKAKEIDCTTDLISRVLKFIYGKTKDCVAQEPEPQKAEKKPFFDLSEDEILKSDPITNLVDKANMILAEAGLAIRQLKTITAHASVHTSPYKGKLYYNATVRAVECLEDKK